MLQTVDQIAERLNELAETLAPKLLPNGHRSGNNWMASGIADTGQSASLYVYLTGDKRGHWTDAGNAAPGEEFGDMLDLLRLKRGLTVAGAVAEAKVILGIHDPPRAVARLSLDECRAREEERQAILEAGKRELARRQQREAQELQLRIRRAKALFLSGREIDGTGAEWYLRNRGLTPGAEDSLAPGWPGALRYHPEVWCADERVKVPAMLAAFYTAQGEQVATHRTFIMFSSDGRGWVKIDSPHPKKVLGPMDGAFIPICKGASGKSMRHMPEGEKVYITEGIEDALVVRQVRPQYRCVCAGSLVNVGAILLPEQAKTIVIVCDRDPSERAQANLERAIARHQARGIKVELAWPAEGFKDYNEWLQAVQAEERRHKT